MIIKSAGVLAIEYFGSTPHILAFHSMKRRMVGLPHGKLDPGETLEECAIRECLEETGRIVEILPQTPYVGRAYGDRGPFAVTYRALIVNADRYHETEEGFPLMIEAHSFLSNNAYPVYCKRAFKHFKII